MMKYMKPAVLGLTIALPMFGLADEITNVVWKSSLSLGATVKQGNTEKSLYTMNIKADRATPKSNWINSLYGEYGETETEDATTGATEDVQTEGQLRGQSDYRYKFSDGNWFGGAFGEVYHDVLKEIDYRVKLGPNLGYYFIKDEKAKFDMSFGINYVHEKSGTEEENFAEYRVGLNYLRALSETASYYLNIEYTANVEDVDDGGGLLVTGVKSKINSRLSLFVELRDDYDNMTPEGSDVEHNDVTFLAGLTYDLL